MFTRLRRAIPMVALIIASPILMRAQQPSHEEDPQPPLAMTEFQPKWQVGDSWTVETQSATLQTRGSGGDRVSAKWKYEVTKTTTLEGQDCFVVSIDCASTESGPKTRLWIDRATYSLRQLATQVPVPGGFRTLVEHYTPEEADGTAVISPLTALPVDLPRFSSPGTSDSLTTAYRTFNGQVGSKDVGGISFLQTTKQVASPMDEAAAKELASKSFEKAIDTQPIVSVELKDAHRNVTQVWRKGLPWPVFADNGVTQSRLTGVQLAVETDAPAEGAER